jgi:hypothetical protein
VGIVFLLHHSFLCFFFVGFLFLRYDYARGVVLNARSSRKCRIGRLGTLDVDRITAGVHRALVQRVGAGSQVDFLGGEAEQSVLLGVPEGDRGTGDQKGTAEGASNGAGNNGSVVGAGNLEAAAAAGSVSAWTGVALLASLNNEVSARS